VIQGMGLDNRSRVKYHSSRQLRDAAAERRYTKMIHKDMTVGEVLRTCSEETLEDVVAVFNAMGMHCLFCPHSTAETLEQAAMVHGNDVDTLVAQLNEVHVAKA